MKGNLLAIKKDLKNVESLPCMLKILHLVS